ncbi:hypothetical protein QRO11_09505 [Paracidovorax citrulli]|uniref:hypothetical protein n=1 Tax=Paracidovorax citrulli TaxID=80869 RepID=UPI000882D7EF|nr:hypothetical protein [Paracidovorax citrulli]UMT88739.1 hypothetical protein FRC90_12130 [Paracidovorax citrulli]WIY36530.1 hypothetical protein QRO11_09505 [Paracidovorax citrulli]SDJ91205.1 hypothetical protein SAMN04489709_1093 [Paracidovorax citrulli]
MDFSHKNKRLFLLKEIRPIINALEADLQRLAENPKFRLTGAVDLEIKKILDSLKRLAELIRLDDDYVRYAKISFEILASIRHLLDGFVNKILLDIDEVQLIDRLGENAALLNDRLASNADDAEKEAKKLNSRQNQIEASELRAKYAALSGAAESMGQKLAAAEARIAALSEFGSKSAETIDEVTKNLGSEARKELGVQLAAMNVDINNFYENIRSRSEEFEGYQKQAIDMLGQMSATVLSGGYLGSAQREESAANLFRWLCIGLMGITVVLLISTIYKLSFDGLDWKIALTRLLATLLMAVPTAYLARESGKHRIQANKLRKTSLDFSVLEPFLKSVEGEVGTTLRSELARRVFFSDVNEDKTSSYTVEPQIIILKALDAMEKIAKR